MVKLLLVGRGPRRGSETFLRVSREGGGAAEGMVKDLLVVCEGEEGQETFFLPSSRGRARGGTAVVFIEGWAMLPLDWSMPLLICQTVRRYWGC